jgi:hydroxymethylbilane synthase
VRAEREVVMGLRGDCHSPIAAWAEVKGETLVLQAAVGGRDGTPPVIRAGGSGVVSDAATTVQNVLESLKDQGAEALLHPPT